MLHPSRQRGALAEMLVAYRFIEAGHLVSWPLLPCAYDLVVDAGARLLRVQVKQASPVQTILGKAGHWTVRLTKRRDDKDQAIPVTALDVLCVVLGSADEVLVIPVAACTSLQDARWLRARIEVGPQSKYRLFLNRFALGQGDQGDHGDRISGAPIPPARKAGQWQRPVRVVGRRRKEHRRLAPDVIAQIAQMPIRWYQSQPPEGLIPLEEIARQFDVHPATLRNTVLRRDRLDLQAPPTT